MALPLNVTSPSVAGDSAAVSSPSSAAKYRPKSIAKRRSTSAVSTRKLHINAPITWRLTRSSGVIS